ncbi:MAG: O-antigen ligase family protein [Candidatus Baltobacteraceae bacterium]
MSVSARRSAGPFLGRALLAIGLVALMGMLAAYVGAGAKTMLLLVGILALAPLALYVAIRAPLLFPVGLYLLLVPFDPLLSFSGGVGPTLTRYTGLVSGAALVAGMLVRRHVYAPPRSWYAWLAAVGFMVLTSLWSINLDHSLLALQQMLQVFGLATLLALYPIQSADLKHLFRIVIASAVLASLYAWWFARGNANAFDMGRLIVSSGNLFMDPNVFGATFLLPTALVVMAFFTERRLPLRLLYASLLAAFMVTLLLCASRGALLGVGVIVLYLAVRTRNYLALSVVGALGAVLSFAIPGVWARFAAAGASGGSGRADIWAVGVHALREGAWLLGVGFGGFGDAYSQNLLESVQPYFAGWDRVAHNVILQSWVETGIFGLLLVLFAWWRSFRQNADVKPGEPLYGERLAVEAAILALFCDALTIDMIWHKYLWLAFALAMMIANVRHPRALLTPRLRISFSGVTLPGKRGAPRQIPR